MKFDGIRQKVFLDRYSLKDKEGNPLEQDPSEMWRRVAKGIAGVEKKAADKKKWEEKFYKVMEDFKFLPGGRIFAGAGTGFDVTYFNCFVIPNPPDSRGGIMENLTQMIEIMAHGGGVGLNLSGLRPRGARVKKVNGFSSGPMNWAELYSLATKDIVQQGGSRRGALMLMIHDWHPDVEEFITVKQDLTKINGANLSVCVSDDFMEAVKTDSDWDLMYPDLDDPQYDAKWNGDIHDWKTLGGKVKVYKTVKASYLWNLICEAAWRSAEPGLHFLDRSNKRSNTWYFEKLLATNPCVTNDTWVQTSVGPRQVRDLIGTPFVARVDGQNYLSGSRGFFKTATKQVVQLQTKEGHSLSLTPDHKVRRVTRLTRYTIETEWIEAGKLTSLDKILLHDHRNGSEWKGIYSFNDGYLVGLLVGDGTLKKDKAILSVWEKVEASAKTTATGAQAVMQNVLQVASTLPHKSDFTGWMPVSGRTEHRLSLGYVKDLANALGMTPGNKAITEKVEQTSSNFYKGFLRGFFDADGSVQGMHDKGVSVRLSQSDLVCLQAVQRMLLRLGIASSLYKNRRVAGKKALPNGKGGLSLYQTKSQHELVISGENILRFSQVIGFGDSAKSLRLQTLLASYKRTLNKEHFIAHVESITQKGIEDVYDVQVSDIHAFDANGFYVHNCGEQPLGAWAVCNLGAMNLSAYVREDDLKDDKAGWFDYESFGKDVQVAMRFLDNVIDDTHYFFKENEKVAKDIRRTGLGIMGIADTFIKMKIRYGSEESIEVSKRIFETLRDNAYIASADIAREKGTFPKYDRDKYLEGYHIKALPKEIRDKIYKQGIRNAVLLTIAPTGTTSLIAGVSSGVEPVYEFEYSHNGRLGKQMVYHSLYGEWKEAHPTDERPAYFVAANDLTPEDHVRIQAVAQEYIDSSISKTVNAPNNHTIEDVKRLYMLSYEMGLKGVTYFRDGSRMGVLQREDKKEEKKEQAPVVPVTPRMPRPMMLTGVTYKTDSPSGKVYVTMNEDEKGNAFEVFINHGKSGSDLMALADALGRMISFVLRIYSPVPARERVREIVSELAGIGGAKSIGFGPNRVRSLPDAIAKVLARHNDFRVNG
ncbi:MAG TPA: LAGLIDADG family homing endonuclease, partial [Methylomirabilota bacterium]|nr:LAGLIDADG family homing endonuclease [Methylomirabilota bacterium]